MVGIPGSGKSTYAKKTIDDIHMTNAGNCAYISRDEVRFSMVKESEEYFSRENEVFDEFIRQVNAAIASDATHIFVDATHISEASRNKTLDRLNLDNVDVCPVVFDLSAETCISQNENRTGRAKVPKSAIRRMYYSFKMPDYNEKYTYSNIIVARKET